MFRNPHFVRLSHTNILRKQVLCIFKNCHFPPQKPKHPTTGIIAITLAFHICHEVHLAGFKYNFSDLKSPLHYYGNATMSLMNKVIDTHLDKIFDLYRVGKLILSLLTVTLLREQVGRLRA